MSASSASPSIDVNEFSRCSQLAAPLAKALQSAHAATLAELASGASGWHGPDDIRTLEGLGGSYLWSEDLLRLARISFRFDPGRVGSQGTYEIISGLSSVDTGPFYCVPNNPAIGWAGITLAPGLPPRPRTFIVAGMVTDRDWTIQILLLNKLDAQGLVQPPFSAVRMP
jgi:hypothetical protein